MTTAPPSPDLDASRADTLPAPAGDEDAFTPARLIADRERADRDIAAYLAGEDRFTSWGDA